MKSRWWALCLILLLVAPQARAETETGSDARLATHPASPSLTTTSSLSLSITRALPPATDPSLRIKFEPAFLKEIRRATDGEVLRGIVFLHEQVDVPQLRFAQLDRVSRANAIIDRLQALAQHSQRPLRAWLEQARLEQRLAAYQPLWIVNGIAVQGDRELFWQLAARPDVAKIRQDHLRTLSIKKQNQPLHASPAPEPVGVQWNVERVRANLAWDLLGVTGEGVVIASLDSGVDWQHPDLITTYRGYASKPLVSHTGNWYCATDEGYAYPGDGLGHGTHTVGTMVGQNGLGVAPGAQWIAVKIFDNRGQAYDSWIHDGFQWLLAPGGDPALAPDMVNGSWGSSAGRDQEFLADVQALRAAGILTVFAAGNHGPDPETIDSPASYGESLAVGATDRYDLIARFSSRGPSPWNETKPEVSAPGVDILSTLPGGTWGEKEGTSMAAPHVAGLAALVLQANPALTVGQIESILIETATPLGEGHPNNDYGWGLVDAYAAVTRAGDFGQIEGQITGEAGIPLLQATVRAASRDGLVTASTTTGPEGRYGLPLSAGTYDVSASAFGYDTQIARHVVVTTGQVTEANMSLTPLLTGTLQGTVVEETSGAALQAGISVPGTAAATTSNPASGAYSMSLPEGTHLLRVESPGHRVTTTTLTISAGLTAQRDFVLARAPSILLVDSGAWYNDSQRAYYEAALNDLGYLYDLRVVANVDAAPTDIPTLADLTPYDLVIWSAPQDSPGYIGATAAITDYLGSGGRLLLSGQDVAYWDGGGSGWQFEPYLARHLKARYIKDDADSRVLTGQGILFAGLSITITGKGGADNQIYPDVIASTDPDYALPAWQYVGDGSGGQTVGPCLPHRALLFSFGLEGITDPGARRTLIERSIGWLTAPLYEAGIDLKVGEMPQVALAGDMLTHTLRLRNTGEVTTDTLSLELSGNRWPTVVAGQAPVTLGACQSAEVQVHVTIPGGTSLQTVDTALLTAVSALSPTLVATASLLSKTPAPVLLVDGARFYDVQERYAEALRRAGIAYDYRAAKGVWPAATPTVETLGMYPTVLWYTAYDWVDPLAAEEQARLIAYLKGGGRLLLSSQDYLYYGSKGILACDYLGVLDYGEDQGVFAVHGEPLDPIGWAWGPHDLTYPYNNHSDTLTPTLGTEVILRGQHDLPVMTARTGDGWRTLFAPFPLEALDHAAATTLLDRAVGWLSWLGGSDWSADRRTLTSGSQLTMTCVLHNDGPQPVASATFSTTIPGDLSLIAGSVTPGAIYHPLTRTVTWEGGIGAGERATVAFRAWTAPWMPDGTTISFPAYIGYDDLIAFERPTFLRVNAPDLSSSTLTVEPTLSSPLRTLTYTLMVRNTGVREATATITGLLPSQAVFTGTLDHGGIGTGEVTTDTIAWTGALLPGQEIVLRYHAASLELADHWLIHRVRVVDQYGEIWSIDARTEIRAFKSHLPLVGR